MLFFWIYVLKARYFSLKTSACSGCGKCENVYLKRSRQSIKLFAFIPIFVLNKYVLFCADCGKQQVIKAKRAKQLLADAKPVCEWFDVTNGDNFLQQLMQRVDKNKPKEDMENEQSEVTKRKIIVKRIKKFAGSLVSPEVIVDGKSYGKIKNGKAIVIETDSNAHTLSLLQKGMFDDRVSGITKIKASPNNVMAEMCFMYLDIGCFNFTKITEI